MFMFPAELAPLLIYVVTNGVKSLLGDPGRVGSIVIAAGVGAVLFFGESVINALGPDAAEIAGTVVNLILLVLSGLGVHDSLRNFAGSGRA